MKILPTGKIDQHYRISVAIETLPTIAQQQLFRTVFLGHKQTKISFQVNKSMSDTNF